MLNANSYSLTDRRSFLTSVFALPLLSVVSTSKAQEALWPAKPIRIVVPFTPGGTTDFVTRLVASEVQKSLGQSVIVENKPGAGTIIGVDFVARAPADGYTLVCVANSFTVNQTLVKKLPYDSAKDLKPVALMGMSEHVLVTHPTSGIRNLTELVNAAKARPGALNYASFGAGTSAHLAGEMLKQRLGIDLTHVPYKGQAPALTDLLGGQVTMMFGNWPEFRGHVQSGRLIPLGMATAKRSAYASTIPTLAELGTSIESNSWNGLLAPMNVPETIIQKLNLEVNKALNSAAIQDAFAKGGIANLSGTSAQFGEFLQMETRRYAEVIRRANIPQIE